MRRCSLANYEVYDENQKTALKDITWFLDDPHSRWIAFLGTPGTGKGHLSYAIGRAMLRRSVELEERALPISMSIQYVKYVRMMRQIRSVYSSPDKSERDEISKFDRPAVLAIDEIGLGGEMTRWERSVMDDVFDHRYEKWKGLILTSNSTGNELFGQLGERIHSRFRERGRVVICDWEDYRGMKGSPYA